MTAALDETPGAFYPGLTHSLYGESESGKSLIAQWAVIEQLAAGQRVLYVDFESNADQIVPRLIALAAGHGLDLPALRELIERLDYVSPQGRITQSFIDGYLTPGRYGMAIVDGVTASISMWGAKSNSGDEFTAWHLDLPERIARMTGAAVIVIDHVNKENNGRFATGTQAKMAVLTGSGFLVDVRRPFAPGQPGEAIMLVGKDRPGDVRAHAGPARPNKLQPWARVTIDGAEDGSKIKLVIEAIDDDEQLDDLPGEFAGDTIAWTDVAVPDEIGDSMLKGKGKAHASDILRVMFHAGTANGLTQADIRSQWHERRPDVRGHRSRFAEAWSCLDRSQAISNGLGGASRYVLSSNFETVLKAANARP